MRKEDHASCCSNFLDVLKNTLERELFEELGISVSLDNTKQPFVIYIPSNGKSSKHIAIGWKIKMDEDTKFRLDSYELVQRKGKTKSGTFIPLKDITNPDMNFEPWSKAILLSLFSHKLNVRQKDILRQMTYEQMDLLD